jgi:hypothetical protein
MVVLVRLVLKIEDLVLVELADPTPFSKSPFTGSLSSELRGARSNVVRWSCLDDGAAPERAMPVAGRDAGSFWGAWLGHPSLLSAWLLVTSTDLALLRC